MATYTTLRYGSSGSDVKKLQQALINAGYDLGSTGADGIYGNKTAAAVKAYQKANGLSVDGIAGNQTLGKLYGGSTTTTPKTNTPATTTPPKQDNTFKYTEFEYPDINESDAVKQANALLEQYIANKPGEYQSKWQTYLDDIMSQITNREDFSYDLNGDMLYQQYKDQYSTLGELAMMDTMGQAQAATGGYGSSYAQGVGQQAYQGYLQQLNDKVPELYQLALNQYNQEGQDLYNQYSLYADRENQDYSKYRDSVSDYYTELEYYTGRADTAYDREVANRDYALNLWADEQNYNYQLHRDSITDAESAKKYASDLAMSMLSLGTMPSSDVLRDAGISQTDAQAIVKKVNEQAAASAAKSSSGNIDRQGGSEDSDFIRFTYSGIEKGEDSDGSGDKAVFYRDGKKYTFDIGVNPYTGTKHKDAQYGTFSNGYQPNNIGGKKLKAQSEYEVYVNGVKQSVWSYDNGKTLWAWDGSINEYVDVTSKKDELKK